MLVPNVDQYRKNLKNDKKIGRGKSEKSGPSNIEQINSARKGSSDKPDFPKQNNLTGTDLIRETTPLDW